jgi:flagellar biosynthesis GTPase FlhF
MKAALLLIGTAVAVAKLRSQSFLGSDMQPEAVAHTLVQVEDEWRTQAASFAECNATLAEGSDISECDSAPEAFRKSCTTVVSAVVKASSGNKGNVREYMGIVCGESELSGWHRERCNELTSSLVDSMSYDNYENRENFNEVSLCSGYWEKFAAEEKVRVDQERAEREAAEKKAEEERIEAEKKAAIEAAEAEKRRAKEEAERRAAEARKLAEQAAQQAEMELKLRKEEAERQALEAKRKMEEAQAAAEAAARPHREALAKAAEVAKKFNATSSVVVANASTANMTHAVVNGEPVKVVSNVTANVTK